MAGKHKKYPIVKARIEAGHIAVFKEIFDFIPPSPVAIEMGLNNSRFKRLINQVEEWVLKDVYRLAELIDVEEKMLLDLIHNQHVQASKKQKK